ncbi:unnamed protein product [Callosobruchus maculatus]|uniref:C2H2-type domain-containing protein n=1 Tax=Callosobruchus maculatus TaxID=64391 RepID=A0A653BLM3_CALMS|nr:unnamed protein product [Callosobruchus maculatus]
MDQEVKIEESEIELAGEQLKSLDVIWSAEELDTKTEIRTSASAVGVDIKNEIDTDGQTERIKRENQDCTDPPIIPDKVVKTEKDELEMHVDEACYLGTLQLNEELKINNEICADLKSSYPDSMRIKAEHKTEESNECLAEQLHTEFDMKSESDSSTFAVPSSSVTKNELPGKDQEVVADKETDGETFVCYHCEYAARSKRHLVDHMKVHRDRRYIYSCCCCDFRTNSGILFTIHNKTHSSESKQFEALHLKEENMDDNFSQGNTMLIDSETSVVNKRSSRARESVIHQVHRCTKCNYKTISTMHLKRHMVTHSHIPDDNRIATRCIYCDKTFVQKVSLDDHIVRRHPDFIASGSSKVHECTKCTYKTVYTSDLKQHMVTHSDIADKNHIDSRCIYCDTTFARKLSLDDHIVRRHPDFIASVSSKVHECTKCTYKTTKPSNFRRHLITNHPEIAGNRILSRCIYCNKTFKYKQGLDNHIIKIHPDFTASVSSKVHECTKCTYKSTSTTSIRRHLNTNHPEIAGNVVSSCIHCNKIFSCKKALDDHIVRRHPDFIASVSSKIFECKKCTYKTVFASDLKRHMVTHSHIADNNRISRRCIYCDKTFVQKVSLDDHIVRTHPDFIASVSSKVHECTKCTYKTTNAQCIRDHLRKKHHEIAGDRILSRCIYCNKIVACKQALNDHIVRRHPDFIASVSCKVFECKNVTKNELPGKDQEVVADKETDGETFVCYHCEYAARSKRHLVDHMKVHQNRKYIYSCCYCDFRTNSGILFTTHNKTHSLESKQFEALHVKEQNMDDNFNQGNAMLIDSETSVVNKRSSRARESVSSKVHQCTKCNYKTTKTEYLKRHLVTHSDNRIISRCLYCNKPFTRKLTLDDHIVRSHPDFIASVSSKVYECTKCTYKTVISHDLKLHMVTHSHIADNNRIARRCIYCDKTFKSKQGLDDHIVRRHPDFIASVSRTVHECTKCTYKTTKPSNFRLHLITNHPEIADNRILSRCIYCNKTFKNKQGLDNHIIKIHPDFTASVSSKVHECTKCTYKTVYTSDLKQHMVKHSDIADKNHINSRCIYCDTTFARKLSLDDHIVRRHPDFIASVSRTVHECRKCTYKTVYTSYLKQHMVKHSDIADKNRIISRCLYCNKPFTRKLTLDDHIVRSHPDFIASVSGKVHECTKCTYKTVISHDLKLHMVTHSHIADNNRIAGRCIYCDKTFKRKQGLDDHIIKMHPDFTASVSSKVHDCTKCAYKTTLTENELPRTDQEVVADKETDGDTFVCYHCEYAARSKRHLIDHMKVHRNKKYIYSCCYCDFRTNSGILFTTHNKTHSLDSKQFEALHVKEENMDDNFSQGNTMLIDSETSVVNERSSRAGESVSSKVHQCTKCNYKTTKTKYLKRHLVTHSDNRIISRCLYCNKTFTRKETLDDHIVRSHPDFIASVSKKAHECTKCTYKTTISSNIRQHLITNHPEIAGNVVSSCIHCNKIFSRKQTLDDHIVRRHPDFIASVSSKVYECTKCTYKTVISHDLKRHMVTHSDNRIISRCIYCDKTFKGKQGLDDHIIKIHPDFTASVSSKVHECTKCTYKTTSTTSIRQHLNSNHPEIAGNVVSSCIHCNKIFSCKQALDHHIVRRHPDFVASVSSKVHECTKCTYKTTKAQCFRDHLLIKHPEIAGNRILSRCIYCNKTFKYKQGLNYHIIKRHPDFIASVSSKVHECTKCSFKTVYTSDLKRHMVTHSHIADNNQ